MNAIATLLLSNNVLEGSRRVTASLRPLRVAFLVDTYNPASALAAIASCTVSWGGVLHLLIPCRPGDEPEGMWSFMLDRYDPDEIVDMVGASQAFVDLHGEHLNRLVTRWEYESEPLMLRGTTVFSPLRLLKDDGNLRPDCLCPHLTPLPGHPFALPFAFRWGYLGDAELPKNSLLTAALESARHDDYVALDPVDPASLEPDELIRLLTETTAAEPGNDRPGWVRPFEYSLLELTLTNTWPQASFRERWELEPDERPYGQSHSLCVVVAGPPSSVPDLCLAWNLRAQRPGFGPFPLWVDPSWLRDAMVAQRLDRARNAARGRWIHREIDPWLGLVSASLTDDELSELAGLTHRGIRVDDRRFEELFPDRLRIGLERESIADFREGQADVVLPDLAKIGHFYQGETIGVSVEIDGWKSPRTAGPPFRSSGDITRVADDGLAGELWLFQRRPYDLVRVRLNPAWRVVVQIADRAGYAAEISDKGRQAIAILNLIEDPRDLALLASSKVYALLRDMARIVPRQAVQQTLRRLMGREPSASDLASVIRALEAGTIAGGQFERPYYDWNRLRDALGIAQQDAAWLVEWLVRCRFLFRGYQIRCPECGLPRWYSVDRLGAVHLCDGCQATMPLPLPVDQSLVWRYRLNEVMALGVDQGVLPHLLALRRIREWGYRRDAPLLGVLPGLTLTPLDKDGPPKIEVDLFAIHDGRIVVGECKANGSELTANEVERFAALGKRLDCSAIVYATPTTFSEVAEVTALADSKSLPIDVELWESPDMLEPRPHVNAPQQDPVEYLHKLITWRRSESD